MSTPRKNYTSPYAKPVHQYPSQNEDYISFGVGGQFQSGNDRKSGKMQNSTVFNRQRRGSTNLHNNPESYNSGGGYGIQKQWITPRKSGQQHKNKFQREKHEQPPISYYIHPSMTEDPWQEFMARIDAINNSEISIKSEPHKGHGSVQNDADEEGKSD